MGRRDQACRHPGRLSQAHTLSHNSPARTALFRLAPLVKHEQTPIPASGEVADKKKTLILDAAEALFAEQGYADVSIRDIALHAKANVAAVNYHFGSKERLFEALFARRVVPVNEERLVLLAAARQRGRNGKPALRELVEAFVRPPLLLGDPASHGERGLVMMRFLSRMLAMPREHVFLDSYYGEVRSSFIATLREILPGLPFESVLWRYNLMVGALIYALAGPQRMLRPPDGLPPAPPVNWVVENAIAEIVDFCTAGLSTAGTVAYQ
jgi:AcrR family transcriptional regulator